MGLVSGEYRQQVDVAPVSTYLPYKQTYIVSNIKK